MVKAVAGLVMGLLRPQPYTAIGSYDCVKGFIGGKDVNAIVVPKHTTRRVEISGRSDFFSRVVRDVMPIGKA